MDAGGRGRLLNDGEQVAPDTAGERLHECRDSIGRDGGVDSVAAALEDASANGGCQRMGGGDDAIAGCNQRARAVEC